MKALRNAKIAVLATVLLTSSTRSSFACMWDRDTLVDEQRGLPEITAIIVGRYERHTPEYYQRRIRLANEDLKTAKPESAKLLLDDISVAQDRLDEQYKAIATMETKIARYGVDYRVSSNLGTFYLHKKDLKQAEIWINRALKINPNAHFGREWVQLKAIKYFQSKGKKLFWDERREEGVLTYKNGERPFEEVLQAYGLNTNALNGINGLIKIGDRDTPKYFAALGQLLTFHSDLRLSAMAYWRALEIAPAKHPKRAEWLSISHQTFMDMQPPITSRWEDVVGSAPNEKWVDVGLPFKETTQFKSTMKIQADLKRTYLSQRAYAEKWRAAFQTRERQIIRSGQNPEDITLFANFYGEWGKPQDYAKGQDSSESNALWKLWPIPGVALISLALLRRARKRKRHAQMA